jgi:hypothetical protein
VHEFAKLIFFAKFMICSFNTEIVSIMSEFENLFLDLLQTFSDAAFYEKNPNMFDVDSTNEKHEIEMNLVNGYNNLREQIAIIPNIVNYKKDCAQTTTSGTTLLMLASHYKMDNYVKLLLTAQNIDVNIQGNLDDHHGMTALMFAIECNVYLKNKKSDVFNIILQVPEIDVHKTDAFGKHALHIAASQGSIQATNALLNTVININMQDNDGNTPLLCAIKSRYVEKEVIIASLLNFSKINGYILDTTTEDNSGSNAINYTTTNYTNNYTDDIQVDEFYILQLMQDYDFDKKEMIKKTVNLSLFRENTLPYDTRNLIVSYLS